MVISGKGASEWGILTEAREEQAPRDKGKEHPLVDFFFFFFFFWPTRSPRRRRKGWRKSNGRAKRARGRPLLFGVGLTALVDFFCDILFFLLKIVPPQ